MVILRTGSVLLGRLKTGELGKVVFEIADIEETSIALKDIAQIQAPSSDFQLDIVGMPRVAGKIGAGPAAGRFVVSGMAPDTSFALTDIIRLKRIELKLMERLDGYLGFGLTNISGNDVKQASLSEYVSYATENWKVYQYLSLITSDVADSGYSTDRLDSGLGGVLGLAGRWLAMQHFQYQKIPSVGLDSRWSSITGGGMRLVHVPTMDLNLLSGLGLQRETDTSGDRSAIKREIPVVLDFNLGMPKYDLELSSMAIYYYGLTDSGRRRSDVRMKLDYEVVENFTVGLEFVYSHDNEPLNATGDENDHSIVLNVGYTF